MSAWEITPLSFYAVQGGGWRVWLNFGTRRAAERVEGNVYDHRWRVRTTLPERFGEVCRVAARGAMNSVEVVFPDGTRHIVSRYAVRKRHA